MTQETAYRANEIAVKQAFVMQHTINALCAREFEVAGIYAQDGYGNDVELSITQTFDPAIVSQIDDVIVSFTRKGSAQDTFYKVRFMLLETHLHRIIRNLTASELATHDEQFTSAAGTFARTLDEALNSLAYFRGSFFIA